MFKFLNLFSRKPEPSYTFKPMSPIKAVGVDDLGEAVRIALGVGKEPKWIRVEDRLPEPNVDVLVWTGSDLFMGHRGRMRIDDDDSSWNPLMSEEMWVVPTHQQFISVHPVTHWMPLPKPPE